MNKQLSIRLHGEPLGLLEQTATGKMKFTYAAQATRSISISMPLRKEPYEEQICEAYFGGLLPESEAAKQLIAKQHGISANNNFSLLSAIGYDCAGAISCHALDEPILAQHAIEIKGQIISDNQLYTHIKALPMKPLFMDIEGLRLSLAGVQDKAAICLINNQIALPEINCPTTHILKPASIHFEGMAENEYFIMNLAKKVGLNVPKIELRKIRDATFLLIERYDRKISGNLIERIHQEDFCQALGIPASNKYQKEGGPGFRDCFDLLDATTQPATNRNSLVAALIFNYLVGNMDAHGKNFSLLHKSSSQIQLAPLYDLLCTSVYSQLTSKMAMKIGSKYDADLVFPRHWKQSCEEINYRYLALEKMIKEMSEKIIVAMRQEHKEMQDQNINHPIVKRIRDCVEKNIEKTQRRLSEKI